MSCEVDISRYIKLPLLGAVYSIKLIREQTLYTSNEHLLATCCVLDIALDTGGLMLGLFLGL